MICEILLKDLNAIIANSYNDFNIDIKKIYELVNSGDFLNNNDSDSYLDKQHKEFAYYTVNYQEINIDINNIDYFKLFIANANNQDKIKIKLNNEDYEKYNKLYILNVINEDYYYNTTNFKFLNKYKNEDWNNIDFIFRQIRNITEKSTYTKENYITENKATYLINNTSEDFWENKNNIKEIFNIIDIEYFFYAVKNKESLYKILSKNLINYILNSQEKSMMLLLNYFINTVKINQVDIKKDAYEELNLLYKNKKYAINYISNNLNKETLMPIDLFKDLINDNDFQYIYLEYLKVYVNKKYTVNYYECFTEELLNNKEYFKFILNNRNKFNDKSYYNKLGKFIVKKNDSEILEILKEYKKIDFLYHYFSKEQKNNKKLIKEIIINHPSIYKKMNNHIKNNKDLFLIYVEHNKSKKLEYENIEMILSLNKNEKIKLFEKYPYLLMNELVFTKHKNDIDIMKNILNPLIYSKVKNINDYNEIYKKVINNKKYVLEYINQNKKIYFDLSDNFKNDFEIISEYIKNIQKYDQIPLLAYKNKDISIYLLTVSENYINNIPKEYFSDTNYILKILNFIDNDKIKEYSRILKNFPIELNEYIVDNKITKGNFFNRISKVLLENDLYYTNQFKSTNTKRIKL